MATAGLTRPDLPPGAGRDLVDALHDLHHRAGWPSLRSLARGIGCSPTTVSAVFSSPRLPSWGLLELVVEAMDGDVPAFREFWRAAGTPQHALVAPSVPIAGRVQELAAVRRHLVQGAGRLLLVTGEAGIGKTRLVTAEHLVADDVFVARGSCLPLSTEVPLLPVAEVLRAVYDRDRGRSLEEAFAECAAYVPGALAPMLPEVEPLVTTARSTDGAWERQQLFAAVRATFIALGRQHRFAVVIEDLHWGDYATLDLLDHVVTASGGCGVPLVGTYRTDDTATSPRAAEWLLRMQRLPAVEVVALTPLSVEETAQQLALLGHRMPGHELAARIHRRTLGHPLFTEQLAAQAEDTPTGEAPLPRRLADLLDQRLAGISEEAWPVARALGVADRALTDAQLRAVTSLSEDELAIRLHDLDRRRLVGFGSGRDVSLGHPLLAEAIRRRLLAGEAAAEHRQLAVALAASPDPSAAEVAEHWQRADDPEQEIDWRIRAAREAGRRFALVHEGEQWQRVLELWPAGETAVGFPGVRKVDAYLAAVDVLEWIDVEAASALAQRARSELSALAELDTAAVLQRAAYLRGKLGDPEGALPLLQQAVRLFQSADACEEYVLALSNLEWMLWGMGRYDESAAAATLSVEVSAALGETKGHRHLLAVLGEHDARAGDVDLARSRFDAAWRIEPSEPDPVGEVALAGIHTGFLLKAGARADEVVAVGRRGLDAAATVGPDHPFLKGLLANIAQALRQAGEIRQMAELIDPVTEDPPRREELDAYLERASLDVIRGRLDAASGLLEVLAAFPVAELGNRIEETENRVDADLWRGRSRGALDQLVVVLEASVTSDASSGLGRLLGLAARAAADLADSHPGLRAELLTLLKGLHARSVRNPFETHPAYASRPAEAATWTAEMDRLAQVALRTGQASAATRLLRSAARDAAEHVPLLAAIRETGQPGR